MFSSSRLCSSLLFLAAVSTLFSHADAQALTRFKPATVQVNFVRLSNPNPILKSVFVTTVDGISPGSLSALTPILSNNGSAFSTLETLSPASDVYVQVVINSVSSPLFLQGLPANFSLANFTAPVGTGAVPLVSYNGNPVPFVTALVTLNDGMVFSIDWNWDEGSSRCSGCGDELCVQETYCAVDKTNEICQTEPPLTNPCQLRVYIAWIGTDASGAYCTSSNNMFSKFTALGVSNLAGQAKDGVSKIVADAQGKLGDITAKIPGQ